MARRDKDVPADETTLPQPSEDVGKGVEAQEQQVQTKGIVPVEPGFFAQRNPKVQQPRGKDRRVTTDRRSGNRRT